jgi:hypothetical protein
MRQHTDRVLNFSLSWTQLWTRNLWQHSIMKKWTMGSHWFSQAHIFKIKFIIQLIIVADHK